MSFEHNQIDFVALQSRIDLLRAERLAIANELAEARRKLAQIRNALEEVVCTEGIDTGVVYLSSEGTTHFDEQCQCQVYDNEFFSPLGDALIVIHEMTKP